MDMKHHARGCLALLIVGLLMVSGAQGEVVGLAVEYRDGETPLEGYLVYDDANEEPRPGVLLVHEWWGLNDYARGRARQLAELGYVAFAVDMYGGGKHTEHPEQAKDWSGRLRDPALMQARVKAGLNVLDTHRLVAPGRIAAIGYCFGGAAVLQLAYSGADVLGVVSFHSSLPVPAKDQREGITARVLACHGGGDPFVADEQVELFKDTLKQCGVDHELRVYPGVLHSFTNPAADDAGMLGLKYSEHADKDSWMRMLSFFDELFEP